MGSSDGMGLVDFVLGLIQGILGLFQDIDPRLALLAVLAVVVLHLLLGLLRGRRRARAQRWGGTKVAPRRGVGRQRPRRSLQGPRDQAVDAAAEEATPDMMAASTRDYHQALEVLLRQPGKKTGARPLKRLLELARVLEQHRAGELQDLTRFIDEVDRLLGFEVHARPVPNSTGVTLRLMHDGELLDEVAGPFRGEIADRVAERARILQRDLVAWLDSLSRLRPTTMDAHADGPRPATRPGPAHDVAPQVPTDPTSASISPEIDLSGLRSLDEAPHPPRRGAVEHNAAREPTPTEPLRFVDDGNTPLEPALLADRATVAGRPDAPGHADAVSRHDEPSVAARRPPLREMPPRLARAIEEVDAIISELEAAPPTSLHAGERFFKADSSERTSLLDRLDRLVFTRLEDAAWASSGGPEAKVAEVAQWFRRQQDQLVEVLHHEFGLRPYDPLIGDPFEPTEHIATETVVTGDPRRDRTVAGTVKHGYVLEISGERRFLERPKVTVAVYESGTSHADGANAQSAQPRPGNPRTHANDVLDVPVDSVYSGEQDFAITVYARWEATAPLSAWIEVDGRRLAFVRAELVAVNGGQSTIQLSGCDIPTDLRRGDGVLVVEDAGQRQARHPFEVLT